MTNAEKAALMQIRIEGTRHELWMTHVSADGKRSFVARIKHLRNARPRANAILNAIWNNYCGNVEAFIAEANRTSPAAAAGLI